MFLWLASTFKQIAPWYCKNSMSDFYQHGLMSTLHRLVDGPIAHRHEPPAALGSVVLVLPCHYDEIGTPRSKSILEKLEAGAPSCLE